MRFLLVIVLVLVGVAAGRIADAAAWSAWLLVGEPFVALATLFAMYLLFARRLRAWAWSVGLGGVLHVAALHSTPIEPPALADPPEWAAMVAKCAVALKPPVEPVRILTWFDPADEEVLVSAVATMGPDIVVASGTSPQLADALVEAVGGESIVAEGFLVHVRGVFHLCGDESEWRNDATYPVVLGFAGLARGSVFPLVAGRLPSPGADFDGASARLASAADAVRSDAAVVVADAGAPWTFRRLDTRLAMAGLRRLIVPPTWPAEIAGLPVPPLHPFARVWASAAWRMEESVALKRMGDRRIGGAVAPLLTTLVPRVIQVRQE